MKKPLGKEALEKEAIFWGKLRKHLTENPVKICRK